MSVTVEQIQNSLRIPSGDTDKELIQNYLTAAGDYVRHAVDSTATAESFAQYSQFDIAVAMLTEFWYQNRGEVATASQEIPFSVVGMIQQLRGIYSSDL